MPDDDCKIDIRHFLSLQSPIANRNSKIVQAGGIAQLVERQLCKLEVRGSNPLASISKEMEAEMRESVGLRCATNYGAIRLVAVSVWNEM